LLWAGGILLALGVGAYAAFALSPWPGAMLIRFLFELDGARQAEALQQHVSANVTTLEDIVYDAADPDALLDVHFPSRLADTGDALTTIVWVHGGGWVSGSKGGVVGAYARVLAGMGFTVVAVDYSVAPAHTYPKPLRQVNAALGYLAANAAGLHVDASRFVLAGDSAGAHIAAQLANAITAAGYADALGIVPAIGHRQLLGTVLYSGAYDLALASQEGLGGWFAHTVLWAYTGLRDFATNPAVATASVINHVTAGFPPSFISAGNGDPLLAHSVAFAEALSSRGVRVEPLFFPADTNPPLPHIYQFNLDTEAGQRALAQSVAFVEGL
jgi:acetyl esterase/lipase